MPVANIKINIPNDNEINESIRFLNKKQREIFDVVYDWGKKFMQNKNTLKKIKLEPLRIFLTGDGGCGKSHLLKCMYNSLCKLLSYHGEIEKLKVLKLAPTGVAAINIDATTIHTGLCIPCNNFLPMSDKQRTTI